MKMIVFTPDAPADHVATLTAFAEGVSQDPDIDVQTRPLSKGYDDCDIAVVFGVGKTKIPQSWARGRVIYEHRYRGKKDVIVLERGYVRREEYFCAGWNGLNGLADFRNRGMPDDRWRALDVPLRPFRDSTPTDHILVCGQVPWDATVQHTNHAEWCREVVGRCRERAPNRPVRFRPHPLTRDYDYGVECSEADWDEDVKSAHCVVTFNSTSGALAVLEGIPVFAMDPLSVAWDVAGHDLGDLEAPPKPDRGQWAADLAYAQWAVEEMRAGKTWEHLKK